jgi:hypothetical protein
MPQSSKGSAPAGGGPAGSLAGPAEAAAGPRVHAWKGQLGVRRHGRRSLRGPRIADFEDGGARPPGFGVAPVVNTKRILEKVRLASRTRPCSPWLYANATSKAAAPEGREGVPGRLRAERRGREPRRELRADTRCARMREGDQCGVGGCEGRRRTRRVVENREQPALHGQSSRPAPEQEADVRDEAGWSLRRQRPLADMHATMREGGEKKVGAASEESRADKGS